MDIIQLLPDSVANQIAAGEVIQRPASVIKELVENAIDAGATNIKVLVTEAGKASIQVIDNGRGMSDTDARLSFERHATSKIRQATDLFSLHTMGFRGEALASIAAVAQVTLQTRTEEDEVGTKLVISASKVTQQEVVSCPKGSNFLVENLFFNIPARRKFLKSNTTEMTNITQAFERIVLVYPEINFSLYSNGMPMLQLSACNFHQRIVSIFGKRLNQQLLPVDIDTTVCKIHGFVAKPEAAKKKGAHQYFFVNGRYMKHPYFHKAVMMAYDRLLPDGEQVHYFLHFTVAPEDIDVNIHPVKTEIKFDNEQVIWQILMAAIRDAVGKFSNTATLDFDTEGKPEEDDMPVFNPLNEVDAPTVEVNTEYNPFDAPQDLSAPSFSDTPISSDALSFDDIPETSAAPSSAAGAPRPSALSFDDFMQRPTPATPSMPRGRSAQNAREWEDLFADLPSASSAPSSASAAAPRALTVDDLDSDVMQLQGRYIVKSTPTSMLLIDQHRASIRVLYEQYRRNLAERNAATQRLLFPEVVEFPPSSVAAIEPTLEELRHLGFEITDLGGGSYSVAGLPAGLGAMDPVKLVTDLVNEAADQEGAATERIHDTLALGLAKAAATPYGELLSPEVMNKLVAQLLQCKAQRYTPDGKLIISSLDEAELSRRFS